MELVGRDREIAEVDELLHASDAGRGGLLLVTGEPGIGKTALCEEAAARAGAMGHQVAWASCWRSPPMPALWPWRRIVLDIITGAEHAAIPERQSWLDHLFGGEAPVADPDAALAWLADTIADAFRAVARPVVAVIDDLHLADERSMHLLAALSPQLPRSRAVVMASCRDDEMDAALLRPVLTRSTLLTLSRLNGASLRLLAEQTVGRATLDADELHRHTGGNPLFARELLRAGMAPGRLPPTVSAVLSERLSRLSPDARRALDSAAVIGDEFSVETLANVLGASPSAVLERLEEAARLGLLEAGATRFSHALARGAALSTQSVSSRRHLHKNVALELESQRLAGHDVDATALAHHFTEAGGDCTGRAIKHTREAARMALRQFAADDATRLLERALDVLDLSRHSEELVDLLIDLGHARYAAGDVSGAQSAFEQAIALARAQGNRSAWGRAALGFAGAEGFEVPVLDSEQLPVLDEAIDVLEDAEPELRARLLARRSVAAVFAAPDERRLGLAEEAVELARRADHGTLIEALAAHCDAIGGPEHVARRLEQASEIVKLAMDHRDRRRELLGRRLRAVALLELGDIDAFDVEIEAYARAARLIRQPLYQWYVPLWRGARALMAGDLEEVETSLAEAERLGAEAGSENAALLVTVQRWWLRMEQGRPGEGLAEVERALASSPGVPPVGGRISLALALANAGRRDEARAILDELLPQRVARAPRDSEWVPLLAEAALAVHKLGGHDAQGWLYKALLPYRSLYVVEGIGACCLGSVERFLAMLAPDPMPHLEAARAADTRAGALVALAHTDELAGARGVLRRDGDTWVVGWNGSESRLRDRKGLHDLARLIAHRGAEMHVLELIGGGGEVAVGGDPQLDQAAASAYRRRIAEIEAALDEADTLGDAGRSTALLEEKRALIDQLGSAYGLSGRPRPLGHSATERARTAVAQRVRDALRSLEEVSPELAQHLRRAVRTGTYCSYAPEERVSWTL